MSKEAQPYKQPTPEAHGWLVDAITKAGGQFIQGTGTGKIWYADNTGIAHEITLGECSGPLPDLTGKKKLSTPENPAT